MAVLRNLILVFGDQLDPHSEVWRDFDPVLDAVWMAEVNSEIADPPAHQWRIVLFLSAMRHFRDMLEGEGRRVIYTELKADGRTDRGPDFESLLVADLKKHQPQGLIVVRPGDARVWQVVTKVAAGCGCRLEERQDTHFLATPEEFSEWAEGRKSYRLEFFYRELRRKHGILLKGNGQPEGGEWNFDSDNRQSFGKQGPPEIPSLPTTAPDSITRGVICLVGERYSGHPGNAESFNLPVEGKQAHLWLEAFIQSHLPHFGTWQDALWTGLDFGWHSRLSAFLNVKLIHPRRAIDLAEQAWRSNKAPLNAVEGFIRQILGWREYIRGVYWHEMPGYAELNALQATADLPDFFWTGQTDMACMKDALRNVFEHGYAHHIQRLMVIGLYALLRGCRPYAFHRWHMAMYLDAVDWVSLPNTLGMSQFGDGGLVASKPYCASGQYINRMSNYCSQCRYKPSQAVGPDACPYTTLYWNFLDQHRALLANNKRMAFQFKNLERKKPAELEAIRKQAKVLIDDAIQKGAKGEAGLSQADQPLMD